MSIARLVVSGALLVSGTLGLAGQEPAEVWPGDDWQTASPEEVGLDPGPLESARDYALTGGGSGCVIHGGRRVLQWGDPARRYDLKSTTKSIGVTALGLAIGDGKLRLDDPAIAHHPGLAIPPDANRETGWIPKITIRHLATQTAGFEKPGGFTRLLFEPGTRWKYSDGGPNWLAECITLTYRRDVNDLLFERVFGPIGIAPEDLLWRKNAYRPELLDGLKRREFGSGISANVDAMARLGYLYLRGGRWRDRRLLPQDFVDRALRTAPGLDGLPVDDVEQFGKASSHYGLLWWNNRDGTLEGVPRDAAWSWGLYDSLIVVIPSLDLVAARAGSSWKRDGGGHYAVLAPFLEPLVRAAQGRPAVPKGVRGPDPDTEPPCPWSRSILGIRWAAPETIQRAAKGSDNWPLTWGDDGALYTAYGDGWGFDPRVSEKLSLGLAVVGGAPEALSGRNVRCPTLEQKGDGRSGKKASGLLMVDGVLYLWARNAGNAQLAWSEDSGKTWSWSDWRLETSFGCPTFVNFGRNYEGARDEYVYVVSPDVEGAYDPADAMLLARVPARAIRDRTAYELLRDVSPAGDPVWTRDVSERGATFRNPGRCWRSGVSYIPALRRYLWVQVIPGGRERLEGGIGIFEAPEPWGPWTTVYYAERWDVTPGDSASFPVAWARDNGKTLFLVFSGGDAFSVRKAELMLKR